MYRNREMGAQFRYMVRRYDDRNRQMRDNEGGFLRYTVNRNRQKRRRVSDISNNIHTRDRMSCPSNSEAFQSRPNFQAFNLSNFRARNSADYGTFHLDAFQTFKLCKLSIFRTLKLANFHPFQTFELSNSRPQQQAADRIRSQLFKLQTIELSKFENVEPSNVQNFKVSNSQT